MKGDIEKLPKWAQNEITRLTNALDYEQRRRKAAEVAGLETVLATGADVWLNPYEPVPTPVTKAGESVRFSLDGNPNGHRWLDVRLGSWRGEKTHIEFHASSGIRIEPRASNSAYVYVDRF